MKPVFLQILSTSNPIDDREQPWRVQGRQHPVPGAPVIVHTLSWCGQESPRQPRHTARIGCDNDKEGIKAHRDVGLTAVGMAFHHVEHQGQGALFGLE